MNNFIELHRYDGEPVLINTRHITAVVRSKSTKDVLVFLRSEDDSFTVTESYEEVKQLLTAVEYVYGRVRVQGGRMSFARKLKRKTQNKRKTRCCGQQMTHKAGYGYVCEKCGKVKHA